MIHLFSSHHAKSIHCLLKNCGSRWPCSFAGGFSPYPSISQSLLGSPNGQPWRIRLLRSGDLTLNEEFWMSNTSGEIAFWNLFSFFVGKKLENIFVAMCTEWAIWSFGNETVLWWYIDYKDFWPFSDHCWQRLDSCSVIVSCGRVNRTKILWYWKLIHVQDFSSRLEVHSEYRWMDFRFSHGSW